MNAKSRTVQRTYLLLTLFSTLAASFIWGINTLFLLDAGLSNTEAFAANAAFLFGQVVFEVPTGVVADTWGRRLSYLLGAGTLLVTTLLYLLLWQISAPFILWAIVSIFLGLGFTFFSGATEAWLVDALHGSGYKASLDSVFAKGQVALGVAMLTGSILGGAIAEAYGLAWPYIARAAFFGLALIVAFVAMRDIGFKPKKPEKVMHEMKKILSTSLQHGYHNRPVRWVIMTNLFLTSVSFYAFYAAQPYLLELFGNSEAYTVAGIAAAIVAGSQVVGGIFSGKVISRFKYRTILMTIMSGVGALALFGVWLTNSFWVATLGFVIWALSSAISYPVFQSFINGLIPSEQRATILSFSSMVGSVGGTITQPLLGRVADVYSYSTSFFASGLLQLASLPFFLKARTEQVPSDEIKKLTPKEAKV